MKKLNFIILASGQLALAVLSACAGHYFSLFENVLDIKESFPLILSLAMILTVAYVTLVFSFVSMKSDSSFKSIDESVENLKVLFNSISGERANIYELEEAYEKMAVAVSEAKNNVTLMTRHRYNREKSRTNIPSVEVYSKNKDKYYDAMLKVINSKSVYFKRLIQVDEDLIDDWHAPLSQSENLSKEIIDVCYNSSSEVTRSSIYVAKPKLDMSFVIIDDRKLFFNIFSVVDGEYSSPYMFYIESEKGNLRHLNDIVDQYIAGLVPVNCHDAEKIKSRMSL